MREVKQCYERHRREIEQNVGQIDFIALAGHVCAFYEPNDYEGWDGRWDSLEYPLVPAKWGIKAIKDRWNRFGCGRIWNIFFIRTFFKSF